MDVYPPADCDLNHSCDPNAGVKTNGQGLPDFYAFRDIAKDEEVRYDYAMTEYRHYERSRTELDFDLTCHCRSAICRGRFGYYSELSAALKKRTAVIFLTISFVATHPVQQPLHISRRRDGVI